MKNPKKALFVTLCVAAVVSLVFGFLRLNMEKSFMATAVPTQAFLNDITQEQDDSGNVRTVVTVWYLVDGKEYVSELGGYHPSMKDEEGRISVYYQPEEPSVCYAPGTAGYTGMFVFGGLLTAAAIVWLLVKNPLKRG